MNGEWNYDLSWELNDLILSSETIAFAPQDVKRVIMERTDPRSDTTHYWILELNSHGAGNFVHLTGTRVYFASDFEYKWLYIMSRHRYSFNGAACECPMFMQRDIPIDRSDGWAKYVDPFAPKLLTVGQIIQDRKDKVVRLNHLRDCTSILSQWVSIVRSEGYT